MATRASLLAGIVAAGVLLVMGGACAAARDGATIVDSGSTNTLGYRIDVWSDGSATLAVQNRAGVAEGAPKSFQITAATASRFFADLRAARDARVTGAPCMKSASFGTTTRITWHDWTSPDLSCPPDNALLSALAHDVETIRTASGFEAMSPGPPMRRGPIAAPSPSATE